MIMVDACCRVIFRNTIKKYEYHESFDFVVLCKMNVSSFELLYIYVWYVVLMFDEAGNFESLIIGANPGSFSD